MGKVGSTEMMLSFKATYARKKVAKCPPVVKTHGMLIAADFIWNLPHSAKKVLAIGLVRNPFAQLQSLFLERLMGNVYPGLHWKEASTMSAAELGREFEKACAIYDIPVLVQA